MREQLIKELQALIDDRDECVRVADFILRNTEELRKKWDMELAAELRDPSGTIWECYDKLKQENDRLRGLVDIVYECLNEEDNDNYFRIKNARYKITEFKKASCQSNQ